MDRQTLERVVEEWTALSRNELEPNPAMMALCARIDNDRMKSHRQLLERLTEQANQPLERFLKDTRLRNLAQRRYVAEAISGIEAKLATEAAKAKERIERTRHSYLLRPAPGRNELRLEKPALTNGIAIESLCSSVVASGPGAEPPDLGYYEASAEVQINSVVSFRPYVRIDKRDCNKTTPGSTYQTATYHTKAPDRPFHVTGIQVDLYGAGYVVTHNGNHSDCFSGPQGDHGSSSVLFNIALGQEIPAVEFNLLGVVDRELLFGHIDDYAGVVEFARHSLYPCSYMLNASSSGAGDVICMFGLNTTAHALWADGYAVLDFALSGRSVDLHAVTLVGEYV